MNCLTDIEIDNIIMAVAIVCLLAGMVITKMLEAKEKHWRQDSPRKAHREQM